MESEECTFGPTHCFHTFSPSAISAYGYILASFLSISLGVQRTARMQEYGHDTYLQPVRRIRFLPSLLAFSFLLRALWFILRDTHAFEVQNGLTYEYYHVMMKVPFLSHRIDVYPVGVTLPGKLATLVYFSAFSLIVRFWDEVLVRSLAIAQGHAKNQSTKILVGSSNQLLHTSGVRNKASGRSKTLFIIINVWMYLIELILIAIQCLFPKYEVSHLLDAEPIVVALFFLALSLVIGQCAYRLRKLFQTIEFSNLARMIEYRVVILAVILSTLFFFRAMVFVVISQSHWVGPIMDPWLRFTIPELLPGVSVLLMMRVVNRKVQTPAAEDQRSLLNLDNSPASASRHFLQKHKAKSLIDDDPANLSMQIVV